jgi:Mg2+ and Co2+ transporter CorA
MMERWLAAWEVDFSTSLKKPDRAARLKSAATDLSDFLHMTAEVRRRLTAFHHARLSTADETWFPLRDDSDHGRPDDAQKAAEDYASAKVKAARDHFDGLSADIQANMDLLMLQSTATQQEASEKVQNSMGLITGLVLVPTFIAGLFGANTRLPGGGTWGGFDLMMLLMIFSAVVVFFFIRKLSK